MKLQSKIKTIGPDGRKELHSILSEIGIALDVGDNQRAHEILRSYRHKLARGSALRKILDECWSSKRTVLRRATDKMVEAYE